VSQVLLAFGPRSGRRARSVSRAIKYVASVRDSIARGAESTYHMVGRTVAAMSPLPSGAERARLRASRERGAEVARRARMHQALEYAQMHA
jgi:hypothetical protein